MVFGEPRCRLETFTIALVRKFGKRNYTGVVEKQIIEKDEKKMNIEDGDDNGFEDQTIFSNLKCMIENPEKQMEQVHNLPISPKTRLPLHQQLICLGSNHQSKVCSPVYRLQDRQTLDH